MVQTLIKFLQKLIYYIVQVVMKKKTWEEIEHEIMKTNSAKEWIIIIKIRYIWGLIINEEMY